MLLFEDDVPLWRLAGAIIAVLIGAVALLGWLVSPAHSGTPAAAIGSSPSAGHATSDSVDDAMVLSGSAGSSRRRELLARATFRHQTTTPPWPRLDECTFVPMEPSGTTPKFDCRFADGTVLKVKYGRNAEPHAEVAATRLLAALGYAADHVTFTERLRCHGCPRYPFLTMHLRAGVARLGLTPPAMSGDGYTDFTWVSVERRFEAPAVETDVEQGWAWWELRGSTVAAAEIDAFRLLAVFLAHWDNKASNQRLVCLDANCGRPLAMLQDVGATFGPTKVNLARWRSEPIWTDRARCLVSMARLPFHGATFPDARISEAGRALLANSLATISRQRIRALFTEARFPQFHAGTDDERDLDAWVAAFEHRVDQIARATCP